MRKIIRVQIVPIRIILIFISVFLSCLGCHSQEYIHWADSEGFESRIWGSKVFHFRAGDTHLLREYMDNDSMLAVLDTLLSHPRLQGHIDSVFVKALASPVGSPVLNMRLSTDRAESLKTYIMWKHPDFIRERIVIKPEGIDWAGFCAILKKSPDFSNRKKLLSLPYLTASDDDLLAQVQSISGTQSYRHLVTNIFPYLQYVSLIILLDTGQTIPLSGYSALALLVESEPKFTEALAVVKESIVELDVAEADTSILVAPEPISEPIRPIPSYLSRTYSLRLKTNLLYWATGTPNIGVERSLTDKWSGELWGGYQPWKLGKGSLRHWTVGTNVNYWTNKVFKGHFFGVNLFYGKYNVGQLSFIPAFKSYTYEGVLYGAGLSYGYYLPVNERLGVEFSIGAGYLYLNYTKYRCVSCREVIESSRKHYFMPNKAGINLIYILK